MTTERMTSTDLQFRAEIIIIRTESIEYIVRIFSENIIKGKQKLFTRFEDRTRCLFTEHCALIIIFHLSALF